ncbi:MAG: helix-hairpin-helix domain-containing protein [Pseudomonadota bacterium]
MIIDLGAKDPIIDATMQPLTIALLAGACALGALLGWLLRGERRERGDAVRLSRLQTQLETQQAALDRQQRQRDELQQKVDDAHHRQHQADRRVATMREALDEQMALRRQLEKRMNETQTRMATEREERKKLSRQLRLVIQRTREARETRDEVPTPEPDSAPTPAPVAEEASPDDTARGRSEDLRLVSGIGPAMKRELAAHGIRTLSELAGLDDTRIDKLDGALRFPGRIRRDRWVEQARKLIGADSA